MTGRHKVVTGRSADRHGRRGRRPRHGLGRRSQAARPARHGPIGATYTVLGGWYSITTTGVPTTSRSPGTAR